MAVSGGQRPLAGSLRPAEHGRIYNDREQPIGLTGDALAALRQRLQGPLLTPVDADYEVARRVWNHSVDAFLAQSRVASMPLMSRWLWPTRESSI